MSLINRILRQLSASAMTPAQIVDAWSSYRTTHITESIARLQRLGMVQSDDLGRLSCTERGRAAAALTNPPRWSEARRARSQPIPATNAR